MIRELVIASSNSGKIREFQRFFSSYGIDIVSQGEWGIEDAEESGATFLENALIKARHASTLSGKAALGDDSGLCVPSLGGAPGIYSARYAGRHGDDAANNAKLLAALKGQTDRRAFFVCTIAYFAHGEDPLPVIANGIWKGEILDAPRGGNGFGYDPLFRPAGLDKSAAQLCTAEKDRHSHRGRAVRAFMTAYAKHREQTL